MRISIFAAEYLVNSKMPGKDPLHLQGEPRAGL